MIHQFAATGIWMFFSSIVGAGMGSLVSGDAYGGALVGAVTCLANLALAELVCGEEEPEL